MKIRETASGTWIKKCADCRETYEVETPDELSMYFHERAASQDGYQPTCKICHSKRLAEEYKKKKPITPSKM